MKWLYLFNLLFIQLIRINSFTNNNFCIPSMIIGVVADPQLFLPRLIKSIDHCVNHLWINKPQNLNIINTINLIKNNSNIISHTIYEHPYLFFGVSEGWNAGLRGSKKAPWYLFCAYDVEFFPNQLKLFSRRYWIRSGLLTTHPAKVVNMAYTNWLNLDPGGYNVFALTKEVITNIGYFDENFFPAFYEDNDWNRRLQLWNGSRVQTFMDIFPWHGQRSSNIDIPKLLNQSKTSNNFPKNYISGTTYIKEVHKNWQVVLDIAYKANEMYFREKWGCDPKKQTLYFEDCSFKLPFNQFSSKLGTWKRNENNIRLLRSYFYFRYRK